MKLKDVKEKIDEYFAKKTPKEIKDILEKYGVRVLTDEDQGKIIKAKNK